MKNLGLLLLLVSLIFLTYYLEEIKGREELVVKTEEQRLIKEFKDFDRIKTERYSVSKKSSWVVDSLEYPASKKLIEDFTHILGHIITLGEISLDKEKDFFKQNKIPFTLSVKNKSYDYVLGDVSTLTGKFYIKRLLDNKIFICQDNSRFNAAYKSELDQSLRKYMRLKSILSGQEDLFIERKLFYHIDLSTITKIKIDGKHNRWFEVNIREGLTNPPKYKDVKYKKITDVLQYLFEKAIVKKLIKGGQNILSNPSSEIVISQGTKETSVKLYAGLNGKYGRYAKFKNLNYIFELDEGTSQIFHTNVQDFWNKKFLLNVDFGKIDSFDYELSLDQRTFYRFKVSDLKKFNIQPLSPEVTSINKNLMNFMFNLIFNLVDFKEARYIEQVSEVGKHQLYIKIFNRSFALSIMSRKIEVIDTQAMIKYHFNYNTQQFKADTLLRIFTVKTK